MQNINQLILNNISIVSVGLTVALLVLVILIMVNFFKLRTINNKYKTLMRGMKDKNLEEILLEHIKNVGKATNKVNDLELQYKKLERITEKSIQNIGVVRFNAFEDTGSDLSFAIALLDAHGNGFIISSIFSRHESRIYTKPVKEGISDYNLSTEETEALDIALSKHK